MKSLIQFIKESLVNETLNASDYLLLDTYEKAKDYFNEHYYNKNNPLEKTKFGISLEDIEHIYDIAKTYHKPAPFVGRYKSNKVFAMRRWVYSKLDEWRKLSKNDKIQPEWFWTKVHGVYAGPHNTSLKEDGSYNPSAEDMEVIIAFAVNKMLDEKSKKELDDVKNIKFCANDKSKEQTQKEENMLNYYGDEKDIFIDNCAKELVKHVKDRLHKLPSEDEPTNEWKNKGKNDKNEENSHNKEIEYKPNNTPKTDLISYNEKYKISLKKAHGAQLMSGAYNEAKATLLFAALDCGLSEKDYNELKDILKKPWAKLSGNQKGVNMQNTQGNKETKTLIEKSNKAAKELSEYLNEKLKENKDFKRALLIEAASGNHKFGEGSHSAANCVFVWSDDKNKNSIFYSSIGDYVDSIIDNVKIEIRWKTNNSSYQALRIETK